MGKHRYTPPVIKRKEYWRDIPGTEGQYQASSEGRIRKRLPDGRTRPVKITENAGRDHKHHVVSLQIDGQRVQRTVLRCVAMAFFPEERLRGRNAIHRNGLHSDNSLWNIRLLEPSKNGVYGARGRCKAVAMVDSRGEVIDFFASLAAAADVAGVTRQTVRKHCNGKSVRALPGGISFRWDK